MKKNILILTVCLISLVGCFAQRPNTHKFGVKFKDVTNTSADPSSITLIDGEAYIYWNNDLGKFRKCVGSGFTCSDLDAAGSGGGTYLGGTNITLIGDTFNLDDAINVATSVTTPNLISGLNSLNFQSALGGYWFDNGSGVFAQFDFSGLTGNRTIIWPDSGGYMSLLSATPANSQTIQYNSSTNQFDPINFPNAVIEGYSPTGTIVGGDFDLTIGDLNGKFEIDHTLGSATITSGAGSSIDVQDDVTYSGSAHIFKEASDNMLVINPSGSGVITAPDMTNAEITAASNDVLITKDYFEANSSSSGLEGVSTSGTIAGGDNILSFGDVSGGISYMTLNQANETLLVNVDNVTFSNGLAAGDNRITNVLDPVDPQDAATRAFVLANAGGSSTMATTTYDNSTSGMAAVNGKEAIDELSSRIDDFTNADSYYTAVDEGTIPQSVLEDGKVIYHSGSSDIVMFLDNMTLDYTTQKSWIARFHSPGGGKLKIVPINTVVGDTLQNLDVKAWSISSYSDDVWNLYGGFEEDATYTPPPPPSAIPVMESYATTISSADDTTLEPTAPTGIQLNDILLMHIGLDHGGTDADPTSTGWTLLSGTKDVSNSKQTYVYWKRATASEPSSYTVNWTGSEKAIVIISRISGALETGSPFDVVGTITQSASSTTVTPADITSTETNTLAIGHGTVDTYQFGAVSGTGWTLIANEEVNTGGLGLIVAEKDVATAGSVGSPTFDGVPTNDGVSGQIINIKSN